MVTPGVHLQDCRDMMADVESNPLLRPFCSDFNDCRSMEVVHYAKFSHSLEEWQSQILEEGSADDEQESHCEAEQGGLQLSEEEGGENEELNSSNFFSPEITKKNQGQLESKVDKGQWKCHSEESSGWFG